MNDKFNKKYSNVLNEDQKNLIKEYFASENNSSIIIKEIDEIIFDEKLRNKLSNSGKKYIDGKGIERLLKKIL